MEPSTWRAILVVAIILLIIVSALVSLAEVAFLNITKSKVKHLVEEDIPGAEGLSKLLEREEEVYHILVVTNSIINVTTACAGAYFLMEIMELSIGLELFISILIMAVLILIFGEIIPETLARRNPEKIALNSVGFTRFFLFIFRPIGVILYGISRFILRIFGYKKIKEEPTITKEELKSLVDVSVEEGVLKFEEKELIENVTEFGQLRVEDVMTQRYDMIALPEDATYEDVIKVVEEEKYSRIPIYRDNTDDIVGILNIKDILFIQKEEFDIKNLIRPAFFTYEFKLVNDLFKEMRKERTHMAIVLDEYGGTVGLVTIEDFLEEIVGEIDDEYDDEPILEIINLGNNLYQVDAATKLDVVNEELNLNITSEDVDSIGGFVIDLIGRFPEEEEIVEYENLNFKILEVEKNRINKLSIEIKEEGTS